MASKKEQAARKAARKTVAARSVQQEHSPAGGSDQTRLLREAAWSRMFGRIESKNPFTR